MISTLIFDFDGTIADSLELTMSVFNTLSDKYNYLPINKEHLKTLRESGTKTFIGSIKMDPTKITDIINEVVLKESELITEIELFPGLQSVLTKLHSNGTRLGILTNNSYTNVQQFLEKHNINFFDHITTVEYLASKEEGLKKIILQNHFDPLETAYIGDESRDIEAANKAGIKSIAVGWGFNCKELLGKSNPDYVIETPEELLSIAGLP